MNSDFKKQEWLKEFTEFSTAPSDAEAVPETSFPKLKARLFPSPWLAFGKILALHSLVGFLSLSFCNQFGLNPFSTDQSLTHFFMKAGGHHICMLLCGTFFMTTTYLLANAFLSLEELEAIKRNELTQIAFISLVSLVAFHFFGAELVGVFVVLWLTGALIGGLISIEGSYRFRRSQAITV